MSYRENADELPEDDGLMCYFVTLSYIKESAYHTSTKCILAIDRLDAIDKRMEELKVTNQMVWFRYAIDIDELVKQEKLLRKNKK